MFSKFYGNALAGENGSLVFQLALTVLFAMIFSLQMCIKGSIINAIVVFFVFSLARTIFWTTKNWVCFFFYRCS